MSRIVHKSSNSNGAVKALIWILVLAVVFGGIFVFATSLSSGDKILNGVYVNGVDLSNKTINEAQDAMKDYDTGLDNKVIILSYGNREAVIHGEDIDLTVSGDYLKEAMSYGKDEDAFSNLVTTVKALFGEKKNITVRLSANEEKLDTKLDSLLGTNSGTVVDSYYISGDDEITIVKGHDGVVFDKDYIMKEITEEAKDITRESRVHAEAKISKSKDIDFSKLYDEIYVEKKDASYKKDSEGKYFYQKEQIGISFNKITAENEYRALSADGQMKVKLIKDMPKITTENLDKQMFKDVIGTFKTNYNAGNTNRSTNLQIASNNINGTILLPGDEFSYNKTVGERTYANGFKDAHIFSGGKVEDGLGGGICQISSTLYNAVMLSNLEIVERHAHALYPEYVKPSLDATVYWDGNVDFRFKNNRETPIKISASAKGGVATCTIYGTKADDDPIVEFTSKTLETYKPSVVEEKVSSMYVGERVKTQTPVNGYKSEGYLTLKDPKTKEVISTTKVSTDVYKATNEIYKVGTKVRGGTTTPVEENKPTDDKKDEVVKPETKPEEKPDEKTETIVTPPAPITPEVPTPPEATPSNGEPNNGVPAGWDSPENPNYRG